MRVTTAVSSLLKLRLLVDEILANSEDHYSTPTKPLNCTLFSKIGLAKWLAANTAQHPSTCMLHICGKNEKEPSVRFGADKEDGAFPLACQITFWVLGSDAIACSAAPEVQALFAAQTNRTEISRRRKDELKGDLAAYVFECAVLSACSVQLCTSEWSVS